VLHWCVVFHMLLGLVASLVLFIGEIWRTTCEAQAADVHDTVIENSLHCKLHRSDLCYALARLCSDAQSQPWWTPCADWASDTPFSFLTYQPALHACEGFLCLGCPALRSSAGELLVLCTC
jgi:hypothetical protein